MDVPVELDRSAGTGGGGLRPFLVAGGRRAVLSAVATGSAPNAAAARAAALCGHLRGGARVPHGDACWRLSAGVCLRIHDLPDGCARPGCRGCRARTPAVLEGPAGTRCTLPAVGSVRYMGGRCASYTRLSA